MYLVKGTTSGMGCLKIIRGMFEVSVSFDDSCDKSDRLWRGDIRVFDRANDKDVTHLFWKSKKDDSVYINNSFENLAKVIRRVDKYMLGGGYHGKKIN